jgi:hypothetical protein
VLQGLDRFGVPTPIATVPNYWTEEQIQNLSRQLSHLQSQTAITVPQDVLIGYDLDAGASNRRGRT